MARGLAEGVHRAVPWARGTGGGSSPFSNPGEPLTAELPGLLETVRTSLCDHGNLSESSRLPADRALLVVTTTEDILDEVCDIHWTLRDAVVVASRTPGRDQIVIPPGTYVLSLQGRDEKHARSGDLDILETVVDRTSGDATAIPMHIAQREVASGS